MKSINSKILKPFMLVIILIPIVVLLVFNVAMTVYTTNNAKTELVNTATGIETLIRKEFLDVYVKTDLQDVTIREKLNLVRSSLKVSKLISNTEFVILGKTGNILFPQVFTDSILNEAIVKKAYSTIQNTTDEKVVQFRLSGINYYAYRKTSGIGSKIGTILYISSTKGMRSVISLINTMLVLIFMLGIAVSIFVALNVAKSIVKPITRLNDYSKQIGHGKFIVIPEDTSSRELNELTNTMNSMSRDLRDNELIQNMFLQNSSHELRTPLMSIQGYAEGIMTGVFSDNVKAAEVIQTESKRLTTLVDELLTLSKIENRSYKTEFIDYNLPDLIKEFVKNLQGYSLAQKKQIAVLSESEFIPIKIDQNLLMKVVNNVLANAIQHATSTITINSRTQGQDVIIEIADDGAGISATDLPHIFERFYKGKSGNFGLGLSIAKTAVEFMSGSIRAYNKNGAVFEITLRSGKPTH